MKYFPISLILFLIISCESLTPKKKEKEPYYIINSKDFLHFNELLNIIQLPEKSKGSILPYLERMHSNWEFVGADEKEVVFINKKSKELLSWKVNENGLTYFLFSMEYYNRGLKEIADNGFVFLKKIPSPKETEISVFQRGNLFVKTCDFGKAVKSSFIIIIQTNLKF